MDYQGYQGPCMVTEFKKWYLSQGNKKVTMYDNAVVFYKMEKTNYGPVEIGKFIEFGNQFKKKVSI